MLMCMEGDCVVGGCNAIATKQHRYGMSCMQKLWSGTRMLVCKLCCEIVLLLNVGDILYAERLVNEQ